jgi:hypothetical protein
MQSVFISLHDVRTGVSWFLLSTFLVGLGVSFGIGFVPSNRTKPTLPEIDVLTACCRFDGFAYVSIVQRGYFYYPEQRSTVAYFPAYPLIGCCVVALTGWDARLALLIVSNLMLLLSFVLFSVYLRAKWPNVPANVRSSVVGIFALWPAGFFFRMTYSESTLLFFLLIFLYGITRRWPLPVLAVLAGFVTATRPVGVAATAAFFWYVVTDTSRGGVLRRLLLALVYTPIAAWGLFAYMGYQYERFGNPLAFAQTQEHWTNGAPLHPEPWEKVESLMAGEPIWGCYDHLSIRYWGRGDSTGNIFFNWTFWNPIFFVGAFVMVVIGATLSWLTGTEAILGFGLLAIPYATRAFEMSMASHGRFAAVVIPAYIVAGCLLRGSGEGIFRAFLIVCSPILTIWSGLFATAHLFF